MTTLPRTDEVAHPVTWSLQHGTGAARWVIRRWYDVRLHGTERIPSRGPVIFSSNHIGIVDGPLLSIFCPRPVHSLTKAEMFRSWASSQFFHFAGQIPLERDHTDLHAVKVGLKVLEAGNALGIYPEGSRGEGDFRLFAKGVAYFALASGAPVVPVVMFGSRLPGHGRSQLPPRGSRIDIVFGPPISVPSQPWPRTREQVAEVAALLHEHMRSALAQAQADTGLELPGPLPAM